MCFRVAAWSPLLLLGVSLLGCDAPPPVANSAAPTPPAPPGAPSPPPPPPVASNQAPVPTEAKVGVFAGSLDDLAARPNAEAAPQPAAPPQDSTERVKAEKGVGIKGRSLDQYEGVLVTPAKAYFSVRERLVFEAQIPQALNLYKASEGQAPKSHDEFIEKIVQANQIKLPPLPPGHKYVYDAATEQLMVERPKQQ